MDQTYNSILVDQTLHGYQDGHRLLEASVQLPRDDEREMLALSDLSGRSIQSGYEETVTGYPLLHSGKFAIAKTWYASEMERPGCVWTHSILIDFADLAIVPDLHSILSLFTRPSIDFTSKQYRKPTELRLVSSSTQNSISVGETYTKSVLQKLYSTSSRPLLLISDDSTNYDDFVFSIWSQQWPKLRRSFSFATKSISPRLSNKRLLEFQFVSRSAAPDIRERYKNSVLIDPLLETMAFSDEEKWLDATWKDLANPNSTKLRTFLREFGSEHEIGREVFPLLVDTFSLLHSPITNENPNQVYMKVASFFPERDRAKKLKSALALEPDRAVEWFGRGWNPSDVLEILVNSRTRKSFDIPLQSIDLFVSEAWVLDHSAPFKTLSKLPKNAQEREVIIDSICRLVRQEDAFLVTELEQSDQLVLLQRVPDILFSDVFWTSGQLTPPMKEAVGKLLPKISKTDGAKLSELVFRHLEPLALNNFVKSNPKFFLQHMLPHLSTYEELEQVRLLSCLDFDGMGIVDDLLKWIAKTSPHNPPILAWAIGLVDPFNIEVLKLAANSWLPLAKDRKSMKTLAFADQVYCGLLLLSFDVGGDAGEKLAATVYPKVLKLVSASKLSEYSYHVLDESMPDDFHMFSYFFPTSLAVRLEQTLRKQIQKHSWNKSKFAKHLGFV